MKTVGIIAEYNPFHNGHLYHITQTKKYFGDCAIAAVMSGSFVQRGEPAFYSKWERARAALCCGADLVIELPVPWALSRAESFAYGAVNILKNTGCVDYISFGSECGDADIIKKAANAVLDERTISLTKELMSSGITFAKAREQAVRILYGDTTADILSSPNNALAAEYCKAIISENIPIEPFTVKRIGASHDSTDYEKGFASASFIRQNGSTDGFVPDKAKEIFANCESTDIKYIERAILAHLRKMDKEHFSSLPDISEGIENRIYSASRKAGSLNDVYESIKTKRYTHARIRRIVMSSFIGIQNGDNKREVPYIRILGFNSTGVKVLDAMNKTALKPVCVRASHLLEHGGKTFETEQRATDIAALCYSTPLPCSLDLTNSAVILKD